MKLTDGILKSIDSGVEVETRGNRVKEISFYIIRYEGNITILGSKNKLYYDTEGRAKKAISDFVYRVFWHGAYWQSCFDNIKAWKGYKVDFSATLEILHSHGETARFKDPKNKKMFKDIANELLNQGIFKIEKVTL